MPDYKIGFDDPLPVTDKGAGQWCKTPQTWETLVYKRAIQMAIALPAVPNLFFGKHSIEHFTHYLNMTGYDLELKDMPELMEQSMVLSKVYAEELKIAREYCETLDSGEHQITSSKTESGYFQGERDLYYAIGGFQYWGKGLVIIEKTPDRCNYSLSFEFHIFDRYNWDTGKNVLGLLDDDFFGEFHRRCFAKEFNIYGVYKTNEKTPISWYTVK